MLRRSAKTTWLGCGVAEQRSARKVGRNSKQGSHRIARLRTVAQRPASRASGLLRIRLKGRIIMTTKINTHRRLTRREMMALTGAAGGAAALLGAMPANAQVKGGILKVSHYANPTSLDPHTSRAATDSTVLWNIYDTLIRPTPDLKPAPGLAESWKWEDGKTLVLHLRPGVKFHDGTDFDAAAVAHNIDFAKHDPRTRVSNLLETVREVEIRDPLTAVLKLNTPDVALLMALTERVGMMASPTARAERGEDHDRNPAGAGMFKVDAWNEASDVEMTTFADYWDKENQYLDGMVISIIADTSTGVRSVLSGQNNFMHTVPTIQVKKLQNQPGLEMYVGSQLYFHKLYFNLSEKRGGPLMDQRVRQAINYAVSKDAFNQVICSGLGEIANMCVPKGSPGYDEEAASRYSYDPEKAKALLAEAGYADGCDLTFCFYANPPGQQRMEVVSSMLTAVGFNLNFKSGSLAQMGKDWNDGAGDVFMSGWTGRPDPALSMNLLYHKSSYYVKGDAEPSTEFTAMLEACRSTVDPDEREEVMRKTARMEREIAMELPLVFQPQVMIYRSNVKGWKPNIIGKPRFNGVWIES
ncbi:ABC transporter substrate-binding protein [Pseudooceanicola sp.]|uniref:ABC transporter substrate-binding protein n=1 Tax=Pseudooceanicola sp. TaxID=1914328 RepID=UPI0026020802|nr:ABC transporter substrate-binding protein [Pseudooceanicola sp.]MDF1855884.1 ABC transporter substrate-binding protein [Pseudooceanicola sp.]